MCARYGCAVTALFVVCALGVHHAGAPQAPTSSDAIEPLHRPFDQILDLYVRDGLVYYRALRIDRARLDKYVASLDVPVTTYERWTMPQQAAFWVNAYNAFVLQTVINHYPIRGKAPEYPPDSLRQIPGAFDRIKHRAAGKLLTLDEIEKMILPAFKDPRLYLALGRGALGSGRLRSEAYAGVRVEYQLTKVAGEIITRDELLKIDRVGNRVVVTSIVSWHEPEFVAAYAERAAAPFSSRSPIERAIIGFVTPFLLPGEREFVETNQFRVEFQPFDWHLNDLATQR